ncbi:MAG: hypothetical protein QNK05_05075 [Myxococcota bacterium]|nr:hypothetical protein [Myxococcota bacterium]
MPSLPLLPRRLAPSFLLLLAASVLAACGSEKVEEAPSWPPPMTNPAAAPTAMPAPQPQAPPMGRPPSPGFAPATPTPSPAPSARPQPVSDPFSGRFGVRYEGADYLLELGTADGRHYQGTVSLAGRPYPIRGMRQGPELVGRFQDPDGSEYGYVGRPAAAGLVFVLEDGETIPFQRVAAAPSPVRPTPPGVPGARPGPAAPGAPGGWPPPPPPPR